MKFHLPLSNRFWVALLALVFLPLQWSCTSKSGSTTPTTTGSGSIPSSVLMPEAAPVPVSSVPGSGLWAVGAAVGYTTNAGGSSVTLGLAVVNLALNNQALTSASVYISANGTSVNLPYEYSYTYSTYNYAIYEGSITYTAGGNYGMAVTTTAGTALASLSTVPGGVTFNTYATQAGATDPGSYYAAAVEEIEPSPSLTYVSTSGTSLSNPYTFPGSAYPNSGPATYATTYCAASWTTSLSGTAGAKGAFVAAGDSIDEVVLP